MILNILSTQMSTGIRSSGRKETKNSGIIVFTKFTSETFVEMQEF